MAERELKEMIKGWKLDELHDFRAEVLVKMRKKALKKGIGNQVLAPFELYTYLLEVANFVNSRPITRIPDDGAYISPNNVCSSIRTIPTNKNPRHRVEFVQKLMN